MFYVRSWFSVVRSLLSLWILRHLQGRYRLLLFRLVPALPLSPGSLHQLQLCSSGGVGVDVGRY